MHHICPPWICYRFVFSERPQASPRFRFSKLQGTGRASSTNLKLADKRGCIHAILGRNRYFADTITRQQNDAFPSCDRLDGSRILNNGSTFPLWNGSFFRGLRSSVATNASQVCSFRALVRVLTEAVLETWNAGQ